MASIVPVKRMPKGVAIERTQPSLLREAMQELAGMLPSWRSLPGEQLFWGEALPHVDVIDRAREVVVRAAVPGFSKEDIDVTSTREAVTIRGQSRAPQTEDGDIYRQEIRREDFLRTIHLPSKIDDTRATATYRDGVLEVVLPKIERRARRAPDSKER
jgi:HSP20 family protein